MLYDAPRPVKLPHWEQTKGALRTAKVTRNEPRNLARFLAHRAGAVPKAAPHGSRLLRSAHAQRAMREADTPMERKAMRELLKIWSVTRGYFPGKAMPIPTFGGYKDFDEGAVEFVPDPQGDPMPIGVQFGRNTLEMLTRPQNQRDRDQALQTVLHEWGHNFQSPRLYRSRDKIDPVREGGAEGFSVAVAPGIARALGRRYVGKGGLSGSEYRPFVRRLLRKHSVKYFTQGQFSD